MNWTKYISFCFIAVMMVITPSIACCVSEPSMALDNPQDSPVSANDSAVYASSMSSEHCANMAKRDDTRPDQNNHQNKPMMCDGCVECATMSAQKQIFVIAVLSPPHEGGEMLAAAVSNAPAALPRTLIRMVKPPATAPPLRLTPIALKQILIV